ncbi:SDR family NAD(P)-dependent oxidoreductase [Actinosynnema sp. NPDC047251]|uniref:3-ketoacyl-(Acyl-carrier-protein) reductase n=1 Tax=Saccharothrix espanaensis (strain ATCC 51144 / DSM 44229 / JCM 9112 / NBRC 15066 / NRRL 15764) TaxID=1179773 RepID=K0K206_SACES|nr:SDR family NAD(P)-dependent oxidoreductase [Saccharothrix espanaensis]CCH32381.1 3-ketoacyl-(acyl-carrier-protein) reductase [Saccharothrix espanaensis DSM 44229]
MPGRLDGKIAFISGTGRYGIGQVAAKLFSAEGAKVFGCARHEDASDSTVESVRAAGGTMAALAPVDLSEPEGAQAWIDAGIAEFGGVDILFNNASSLRNGPFDEQPLEDWYYTIKNELHLPYLCTRAAWGHLKRRGGGVVINMGSVAGIRGVRFESMIPHGVAKAANISLTRHLAVAGTEHNIRAVAISPGLTRSEATRHLIGSAVHDDLMRVTPSRRVAEPEEIAELAVFLASDKAGYINGENIVIDGGVSAVAG